MRRIASIIILATLWLSCKKEESNESGTPRQINGVYAGTFVRTGMDTASVMLTFQHNTFQGESDTDKYPAICHGSFTTGSNSIVLVDSCAWTANFDWSLILNGTYNIAFQDNDNAIRIWRTNGAVTDEYMLRRVVR